MIDNPEKDPIYWLVRAAIEDHDKNMEAKELAKKQAEAGRLTELWDEAIQNSHYERNFFLIILVSILFFVGIFVISPLCGL